MSTVYHQQEQQKFLQHFPWMKILKLSGLLMLYTSVSSVIFFSIEDCLQHNPEKVDHTFKLSMCISNILLNMDNHTITFTKRNVKLIQNSTDTENNSNAIVVKKILQCRLAEEALPDTRCKIHWGNIVKWCYFTVINLFVIGRSGPPLVGLWSQIFHVIFLLCGVTLTARLYLLYGKVGVNILNALLKASKDYLNIKWKQRQRYQIFALSIILQLLYAVLCAVFTISLSNEDFSFALIYSWLMILFSINDNRLLGKAFQDNTIYLILPSVLIPIGFMLTSTIIASIVNIKYQLTYNLKKKVEKKTTGELQGCFV